MSIIGIAKTGVGAAATAAGKLDGWAKEAEQAIADGKSVNMFKKALSGIQFFGQANAALQIVAMGLTAIAMLTGAKSEEDQILDGVNQILGRLATMETDIDNKFKELKIFLNLQTTQIQLQPFLVPIETANGYLQQITSLRAKQQGFSTLETQLGQFNTTVFSNAMTQIRDSCVGSGTQTAPNVLDAVYDMSYGNLTSVWAMGEFLLHNATMALMLHGIVAGIQGKPTNTDVDLSQIASIYQDHLADVASAVEQRVNRCVAAADIEKCLARFISDKRSNPLNILVSDKQGTSGRITDALQGQYDYLNFSAIVYEPLSGYDHHGAAGNNFAGFFRFLDVTSKPLNIIIYWADRTPTNRQARITWQSAAIPVQSFPGPRKDRSLDVPSIGYFPRRPPGSRYQFVYDLALAANKATNHSIVFGDWGHINKDLNPILDRYNSETDVAKHEPGSMIWFGWTDQWDSTSQTDIGMTSYNAMYGLVSPYETISFFAT